MHLRYLLFVACIPVITSYKPLKSVPIADKYLNDAGIGQDADVLYTEHFNDGITHILSRYSDVKNGEGMSLDSLDTPGLTPALKMTNNGSLNDGGHLYLQFKSGFDSTIYLRYYVKYPLSSKGYIHHESVWIGGYSPSTPYPNPRAGICGLGDKRISIAYEPVHSSTMDTYLYWGDMKQGANSRCYGNDMINGSPDAKAIEWDKWMCVELMIKMNNPVSAYNGELKIWQDGIPAGHWGPGFPNGYWNADSWINDPERSAFQGFRWRTDARLNINYLWIEFYDDTTPFGQSHHIKFANLVVARKYIGPIKK